MLVYDLDNGTTVHGPAVIREGEWVQRHTTLKHGMVGRPAVFTTFASPRRGLMENRAEVYLLALDYIRNKVHAHDGLATLCALRALPRQHAAFGEWIVLPAEYVFVEIR